MRNSGAPLALLVVISLCATSITREGSAATTAHETGMTGAGVRETTVGDAGLPHSGVISAGDGDRYSPSGRRCVEPTGEADAGHPSHIRDSFYNQYGCKIPLREGKAGRKAFGYRHIVQRGEEQLAQGRPNSHEVTPFAQGLWAAAIGKPGGSLLINPVGYFVASWQYTIGTGESRKICVFYATDDLSYGGQSYKVRGIVTAYWIPGHFPNPAKSCREARE